MKMPGGPYVKRTETLIAGQQILRQISASVRSAITDQNILAIGLALAGLGMLRRPTGIADAIQKWSAGVITSEALALLFVVTGVYAFNRRLSDREMLVVIIPLIIYVVSAFILTFVRADAAYTPSFLVAAYLATTYRRIVSDGAG